jgi:SAM-dependent methyltransferase
VADAIATAPINKEAWRLAGLPWTGHTDLLAHLTGAGDVAMMFYSDTLRVVLATIHIPLAEVPRAGGWPALPPGGKLGPRSTGPRVEALRRRLGEPAGDRFDTGLTNAVKRFQELVGLHPDGIVSDDTFAALNVSVQNAYEIDFREEFDAVFSNAVLHWLKDADRVIRNVFQALRPGGRFVAECGGDKCCQTIQTALVTELERRGYDGWAANPWYFPTTEDYGGRLVKAGFAVAYIEIIPRPTPLPGDMAGFLETFAGSFVSALPSGDRQKYLDDVRDRLKPLLCGANGVWTADYTRLRFEAFKSTKAKDVASLNLGSEGAV